MKFISSREATWECQVRLIFFDGIGKNNVFVLIQQLYYTTI